MSHMEPVIKIEEDSMEFGEYEFFTPNNESNVNESQDGSPSQRKVRYNSKAVKGFTFPIPDEDTVERLESVVRLDQQVRGQYINFLQSIKPSSSDVSAVFKHAFMDDAMLNYTLTGHTRKKDKKSMRNYLIFQDCMLEAWMDHGVDSAILEDNLKRVIRQIYKRERDRFYYRRARSSL